jgi:hypothetical protein
LNVNYFYGTLKKMAGTIGARQNVVGTQRLHRALPILLITAETMAVVQKFNFN